MLDESAARPGARRARLDRLHRRHEDALGRALAAGGGNKKRALPAVREAAGTESDFYTHAESEFALWDMQVREHEMEEAVDVARRLARAFPDNPEVAAFLKAPEAGSRP